MLRHTTCAVAAALTLAACKTSNPAASDVKDAAPTEAVLDGATPATSASPPETPMPMVEINGFSVSGFEYWPFRWQDAQNACVYPYPDHVQWGYDGGTPAAQKCMKQAYDQLWGILQTPPAELTKLKALGGPSSFFLWVNDYTEAKVNALGQPVATCKPSNALRGLWHYNPPNGLIKWVNEVNKDGSCVLRTVQDLINFANKEIAQIQSATATP